MASASEETLKTRSKTNVWLIGQQLQVLDLQASCSCLPTNGVVLRRLFYDLKTRKFSLSTSCSNVVDELLSIWFLCHIPTTQKPNAVAKLKGLYDRYVKLGKNKARRSDRQIELEDEFSLMMNKLFDVAHANTNAVPSIIKVPEDIAFLEDQRGAKIMTIGQEDLQFKEQEHKRQ